MTQNDRSSKRCEQCPNHNSYLIVHVVVYDDANKKVEPVTFITLATGFETITFIWVGQVGPSLLEVWDAKGVTSGDHAVPVLELLSLSPDTKLSTR